MDNLLRDVTKRVEKRASEEPIILEKPPTLILPDTSEVILEMPISEEVKQQRVKKVIQEKINETKQEIQKHVFTSRGSQSEPKIIQKYEESTKTVGPSTSM